MATSLATYVDALAETWSSLASVCSGLSPAEWETPTELPGWSVKDNVSHVVGVELFLLGEPYPPHVVPDLPHIRNDAGRWVEVPVDLRRPVPGASVLAELSDVTARRLAELRALDEPALEETVRGVMDFPMKLKHLLGMRVFDSWAHEQDVRRALGRPGGLTSAAAILSRRRLLLAMSGLVPSAAGRVVVLETTGALPSVATLTLGASYVDGAADAPDVRLVMDFETFVRLGTGRVAYAPGLVSIAGDEGLAEAFLGAMAITP
ncbi:MAG TPA: maleylpyruvate isomerase family mycothiol-dependent enzyme [Frankiaceae bacterium]|nr:maleylpyruvate isomerase family mycothiol-dependent enzyme [Frankiaceae bacterium]